MLTPFTIDTNIFLRLVPKNDPDCVIVLNAAKAPGKKGTAFYMTQILAEFWIVCTRPLAARDGYSLSPLQTECKARLIERHCHLLTESLATHQEWRRLIMAYSDSAALSSN